MTIKDYLGTYTATCFCDRCNLNAIDIEIDLSLENIDPEQELYDGLADEGWEVDDDDIICPECQRNPEPNDGTRISRNRRD